MQAAKNGTPSRAENPDLDWSQVRETILMLNLAVAQIELSLRNGNDSVTCLGDSFTSMAGDVEMIRAAADALPGSTPTDTISERCARVSAWRLWPRMTSSSPVSFVVCAVSTVLRSASAWTTGLRSASSACSDRACDWAFAAACFRSSPAAAS